MSGKLGKYAGLGLSVGSLFVGAGGFGAGAFKGGKFLKGLAFLGAGSLLGGSQTQKVARLQDRIVPLDQEGAPLTKFWGYRRGPLKLVWCSGLTQHITTESAGKGGPQIEKERISGNFLWVYSAGQMTRGIRLKFNAVTIYDWNGGDERGATLTFADGFWSGETDSGIKIRIYPGTLDQPVDSLLEIAKGVGNWTNYPGEVLVAAEIPDLAKWGNGAPNATMEAYNGRTALAEVIADLAAMVDVPETDFDLSALDGLTVSPTVGEGFEFEARKSPASAMQELQEQYDFLLVEEDGVIRAKLRSAAAVVTIDAQRLRVKVGDVEDLPPATITGDDELDLPEVMEGVAPNPDREFNPSYRRATRNETGTKKKETVSYTASIKGNRLERIVRTRLAERWAKAVTREGTVGLEFLHIGAGDNIDVLTPDGIQHFSLSKITTQIFGSLAWTLAGLDPLIYGLPLLPDTAGVASNPPATHGVPIVFASEHTAPLSSSPFFLRPSFLYGGAPLPGDTWDGYVLNVDRKLSGDADFREVKEIHSRDVAIIGELTSSYTPTYPGDGYTGTIECKVYGGDLASALDSATCDKGANFAVFAGGVSFNFVTATLTGDDAGVPTYTLTDIKAGQYGSDDLIDGALLTGTRFMMLSDSEANALGGAAWLDYDKARETIGGEIQLRYNADTGGTATQETLAYGYFEARNVEMPAPPVTSSVRDIITGDFELIGTGRTRRYDDPTNPDIGAPRYSLGYKYSITLEADAVAHTVTKYTTDDAADFDFLFTVSELSTLFGGTPGAITGTIALWGSFGLGRPTSFSE